MHNVRVKQLEATRQAAAIDPSAARLDVRLEGEWRADDDRPQFGGLVRYPEGEVLFEADFPAFMGGAGRAPTPLAYCFYGAMCCYGATYATQAALAGMEIRDLRISLRLAADFGPALGLGDEPPLSGFDFEITVDTEATDAEIQRVKQLADERCPAIWAMRNPVPYSTQAIRA
jgi:uncharacterized OsmC-like protein